MVDACWTPCWTVAWSSISRAAPTSRSCARRRDCCGSIPTLREAFSGALDDYENFSKKILVERIIRESDFKGPEFLGFGDGYVEIEAVKTVGGHAVGLATDEPDCVDVDPVKRDRLAGVGADWIVPNFNAHNELMTAMFGAA